MKIIATQLDLARQKENLDFIRSFTDFIAKYGYNTLVLYLEAKIKTKSFPYPAADYSYTPEEMREVVGYAKKKKIEIVPVVATLGHAELFLKFPELRKMAELDGGIEGRFWKDVFFQTCPSRKETYEFFSAYLAEIAEIFPSPHFHAGLDESWDIGFCDVCRRRGERDGKFDRLFAEHITKIHGILGKLGKTMWMWDDMFELYPEALESIPRDIVMCAWCYQYSLTLPIAHFLHQKREDSFRKYDRLGFRYLLCPAEVYPSNAAAFTRYARRYKPLGGLLTTWEKGSSFLPSHYPSLACTGKLWSAGGKADGEDLLEQVIRELAGRDKLTIACVRTYYALRGAWYGFPAGYCRGEIASREEEQARSERFVYETLRDKTAAGKNQVLSHILINLRERLWRFAVRKHLAKLVAGRIAGEKEEADIRPLLRELENMGKERMRQWRELRQGIPSDTFARQYASLKETIEKTVAILQGAAYFCSVRLFLPEPCGAAKTKIIMTDPQGKPSVLAEAQFKPPMEDATYYDYVFPCAAKPASVRLEVTGYGGQGVCFVKVEGKGKLFEPVAVSAVEGMVASPGHVLCDDLRWAYLGEGFIRDGFVVNDARKFVHSMEVLLAEKRR